MRCVSIENLFFRITLRNSTVFVSSTWLIFNIVQFSVSGVVAEIFNLTSLTIAIIRFSIKNKAKAVKSLESNEESTDNNDKLSEV